MKLNKIFSLFAAFSLLAVSCQVEEQAYVPGEPELEGCHGVYFPTQGASGSHAFDPKETLAIDVIVNRLTEDGEITVPVEVTASEEGVFDVPELKFADGQTEATLHITFPNANVGVNYSITLEVTDPEFAKKYGTYPTYLSFSVIVEKWNEIGEGVYMDYYFSQDQAGTIPTTAPVKILQNENNPSEFRISDPFVNYFFGPNYGYKEYPAEYFEISILKQGQTFTPYDGATPVTIPFADLIWYENIVTGYVNTNYDDTICYVHPGYGFKDYLNPATWEYNKVLGYQENGLPVAFQIAPFVYMWSVGGWNYAESPVVTILFPGGALTDYSLALAAGYSTEGVQPVEFTFGKDVETIKYAAFEGPLTQGEAAAKAAEVAKDANAAVVSKPAADAEGNVPAAVVDFSFEATGEYTIVAVGCDSEGTAQSSTSLVISYVAANDEVPVIVTAGLGAADKYVPQGFSPETAIEYYVYGQDLTEVKIGMFTAADFISNQQGCVSALMSVPSEPAEVLEMINTDVFVDVMGGLTPGTEYYLLVWASNGYEQKIVASAPWTTAGDPLPVYASYSIADINEELLPATSEGYFGTYNYYVRDWDENGDLIPLRDYRGQVTISDSEIPDSDPDDYGYVSEYVDVEGLVYYASQVGISEKVTFEYYDGVLYTINQPLGLYANQYYIYLYSFDPETGGMYNASVLGGFVDEGYIAFVNAYASQGYNINALLLAAFADENYSQFLGGGVDALVDILLVDPEVDDNGLAPMASSKMSTMSMSDLKRINSYISSEINYVETERGRIHSAIDRANAIKTVGQAAGVQGEYNAQPAAFSAVEAAPVYNSNTTDFSRINDATPALYR